MPKPKRRRSALLKDYVAEICENILSTDELPFVCVGVTCDRKFLAEQHLNNQKHLKALARRNEQETIQEFIVSSMVNKGRLNQLSLELCYAFTSADITFNKLQNSQLRKFFEKYLKTTIPHESTLRKSYLSRCYDATMKIIQNEVLNKKNMGFNRRDYRFSGTHGCKCCDWNSII